MSRRAALILLAALVGVSVVAARALGTVEGLSIGGALLAAWCGATLCLSTKGAQTSDSKPTATPSTTQQVPATERDDALQSGTDEATGDVADAPHTKHEVADRDAREAQDAPTEDVAHASAQEEPAAPSADEPAPADDATPDAQAPDAPFDFPAFRLRLLHSAKPLEDLRATVDDIRARREADANSVCGAQEFLEQELTDAGLYDQEVGAAQVHVVLPYHARLFYLRLARRSLPYGTYLSLLRIEATLNALLFAFEHYDDLSCVRHEDIRAFQQRVTSSICAQAPDVDTADWSYLAMPWQMPYGPSEQGEWSVREALSRAIETVRLPYRLEARFRTNVNAGDIALEFTATPESVFPHTAWVPALGLVPSTSHMRTREASKYAARVGLLLAAHAFKASERIRRVWVSAIAESPREHACLYSVRIERRAFSSLRMDKMSDPLSVLHALGASMRQDGEALLPATQLFYLEDERFCPPMRHDIWQLSERPLSVGAARSLGCTRVSGLVIHEQLVRDMAADEMLRSMQVGAGDNRTQQSVRSIMDAAHATSDLSVWSAAERVASKLVDGSIESDQLDVIREEFVEGDPLSKAVKTSQRLIMTQRPQEALDVLHAALKPLEDEGCYADSSTIAYRSFDSFTERVMYNRLNRHDKRSVVLVPDAYPVAHLTLSALYASAVHEGDAFLEAALGHARRALAVAPLSAPANLGVAACLEALDKTEEAIDLLRAFLSVAYQGQSMGMAYFRLASLMWHQGDRSASRACYYQAARTFPPLFPFVVTEYQLLASQDGDVDSYEMSEEEVESALRHAHIPLAPTQDTAFALYEGATASVDAEVFPVAHDLLASLEALTGDDVIHGIRMSLEHEPDA